MSTRIAPGVLQIDTLLGGWDEVTAGYLVEGPEPCLVETGSQSSLPTVLAELDAVGRRPRRPGQRRRHPHPPRPRGRRRATSPRRSPRRRCYVHEKGARHLVDPDRLVRSAALVYGDLLDALYGRLTPTPGRAGPRAGRRRGDPGRAGPDADQRRLARARQAPPRPARQRERAALRRRRGRRAPAPGGRAAPGDTAAGLRPRPGAAVAAAASPTAARRDWPSPTTA